MEHQEHPTKRSKIQSIADDRLFNIIPEALHRIIFEYFSDYLHLWANGTAHKHWQWVIKFLPSIDEIDFSYLIRSDPNEVVGALGSKLPEAVQVLRIGRVKNLYRSFYELENDQPHREFYSHVCYSVLRNSATSFKAQYNREGPQDNDVYYLFDGLIDHFDKPLWDKKTYHKPYVNLKMLECLLLTCKTSNIKFSNLADSAKILTTILGIGAINNMSTGWYLTTFDTLAIPTNLYIREVSEYIANLSMRLI